MPAKLKTQRKAQVALAAKQDPCCVCLQKFNAKDEILFCAGSCQKYLHRYCASVSEQAFSAEDAEPFLCFCCFRTKKEKQIDTLQTTVESLKAEIESLKAASRSTVTITVSYSDAVSGDRPLPTLSSMNADPRQVAENTPRPFTRRIRIVIYHLLWHPPPDPSNWGRGKNTIFPVDLELDMA